MLEGIPSQAFLLVVERNVKTTETMRYRGFVYKVYVKSRRCVYHKFTCPEAFRPVP